MLGIYHIPTWTLWVSSSGYLCKEGVGGGGKGVGGEGGGGGWGKGGEGEGKGGGVKVWEGEGGGKKWGRGAGLAYLQTQLPFAYYLQTYFTNLFTNSILKEKRERAPFCRAFLQNNS